MGFPLALWFEEAEERITDQALVASLKDGILRSILEEAQRLRPKERRLLLSIARRISPRERGAGCLTPGPSLAAAYGATSSVCRW